MERNLSVLPVGIRFDGAAHFFKRKLAIDIPLKDCRRAFGRLKPFESSIGKRILHLLGSPRPILIDGNFHTSYFTSK